jgi:ectoine hydroxylase-related dioxygenase (phytanoyl-CoA dioxygenase family)
VTCELDAYRSAGFYVAKGLLDEKSVAIVRNSIAKTMSDQLSEIKLGLEPGDLFAALEALHRCDIDRYKKTVSALWRKLDVYQLMHNPRITGFLRDRFGWRDIFVSGGQVVHIMAHELKIPGGYFGQGSHQDFPSVQGSLDAVIAWLPLVEIPRDNFPLEVIPGSHLDGLLPVVGHGDSPWEVKAGQLRDEEHVPVEVMPGDVVFLSVFTVHRSSNNGTPGRCRLAISTRFDNADESSFIHRAYPTAYLRSVSREPCHKEFPTPDQVRGIFRNRRIPS